MMNFVIKELAVWIMLISSIAMINLFVIVLIVIYDGVKQLFKNSKSIKLSKPCPAISIIIPTYNEEGSISSCLDSLVNSDYPKIQIVVADDRSSDSTIDIVKNYQKIYSNIVLYRGKKHLGKSLVLNAVTDSIPNEYIFFVDADVTLTKEFFTNSMLEFVNSKSDYIVPNIYIRNPSNVMQAFQYIEFAYLNLLRMASVRLFEVPFYFNRCAFGIKKSVLKKVGGFALTLTEDIELMVNLYPEFKASYANNAIANVKPLNSIKKIAFQRARWNFGGLIIVLNHSFIKGKLPLNYYFFNVILWHLLSISFLPLFVYFLYINLTAFQSVLFFLINSLTIIGVVSSLYLNPFGITGVLLVGLLFYSILRSKYYTNNYLYMSFLLYFGYLLFMQFSTVLGVIKYMFVKKKIFIN